jgi:hypothetical protein
MLSYGVVAGLLVGVPLSWITPARPAGSALPAAQRS